MIGKIKFYPIIAQSYDKLYRIKETDLILDIRPYLILCNAVIRADSTSKLTRRLILLIIKYHS